MNIEILRNEKAIHDRAARLLLDLARRAASSGKILNVALSGGSTPVGLFTLLASPRHPYRKRIPWESIHFFWGDERFVPPGDPESNFRAAYVSLLAHVPVPSANIHRVPTEIRHPSLSARLYEKEIRAHFHLPQNFSPPLPRFDLAFLGLGPEGHTASLFPGSFALKETRRSVVAAWVQPKKSWRVTFTLPVINHAKSVAFLVSGREKARIVRLLLARRERAKRAPSGDGSHLPASLIRPTRGRLLWLLDAPAAALLKTERSRLAPDAFRKRP